jgi:sugar-phosphatase
MALLRATLFDMDGLLFDTEVLWHEAEVEVFGALGVRISEVEDRSTKGMFVSEVVRYWRERYPWEGPSNEEVTERLLTRVGDLVEEKGRELPGARRTLERARSRGPIALASSTPLALIERILQHFGLADAFASVHSAEFEPYGKPHPAVFLTAARSLGVPPDQCLVFEDSAAGVIAAVAGRMRVVAVPTPADRPLPAFALADLVLSSLEELPESRLDEFFGRP